MRVLSDSYEAIHEIIYVLFNKIIRTNTIPENWKIARIIPLFKKGDRKLIQNYRPISNLCSLAKAFEKCILVFMEDLAKRNNTTLTSSKQYGFKKGRSTSHLGLELQNRIATALDNNNFLGIVSLDLTSAFDVVNHGLLFLRLESSGLPNTVVNILKEWLTGRSGYIESGENVSTFFKIENGTVQGSVLGPVLFSIFINPILEIIEEILAFADDNYIYHESTDPVDLNENLTTKTQKATNWLEKNGLIVNIKKTEYVIFHRNTIVEDEIMINGQSIKSQQSMKILGIEFDSKLNWSIHCQKVISNSKTSCYGLNHLRKFFTQEEMINIATAIAYSKFYYGAQIWLGPNILASVKKRLKAASTWILKSAVGLHEWKISYDDIHEICGRGTPEQMSNYYHALAYYDLLNNHVPEDLWTATLDKLRVNERNNSLVIPSTSKTKCGLNSFHNRISYVTGQIPMDHLNKSKINFKLFAKRKFITSLKG